MLNTPSRTSTRGKQAELAFARIFAEQLPDAQVLADRDQRASTTLALVKTPKDVDWQEGIDFWLFHKNIGWISVDLTIASDPARLNRKRQKARINDVYLVCFELGILIRASRGCYSDLEQVVDILTDIFSEELAARGSAAPLLPTNDKEEFENESLANCCP